MRLLSIFPFLFFAIFFEPQSFAQPTENNSFTDPRDQEVYATSKIGDQLWMVENLRYQSPKGSFLNPANPLLTYGRLYTWDAAMEACPKGWHLPSGGDWLELFAEVGGRRAAGQFMKSREGWLDDGDPKTNKGSDDYGLGILPSGFYDSQKGEFAYLYKDASLWIAKQLSPESAWYYNLDYLRIDVDRFACSKSDGRSVRCLKD